MFFYLVPLTVILLSPGYGVPASRDGVSDLMKEETPFPESDFANRNFKS